MDNNPTTYATPPNHRGMSRPQRLRLFIHTFFGSRGQKEFAAWAEVNESQVSTYVNPDLDVVPSGEVLLRMHTKANLSIDWYFTGIGRMSTAMLTGGELTVVPGRPPNAVVLELEELKDRIEQIQFTLQEPPPKEKRHHGDGTIAPRSRRAKENDAD